MEVTNKGGYDRHDTPVFKARKLKVKKKPNNRKLLSQLTDY